MWVFYGVWIDDGGVGCCGIVWVGCCCGVCCGDCGRGGGGVLFGGNVCCGVVGGDDCGVWFDVCVCCIVGVCVVVYLVC